MYYTSSCPSPIGPLTLASDGERLCGLWTQGQKYFGASIPGALTSHDELPIFDQTRHWLDSYFTGGRPAISALPLAPIGSDFRQAVWALLCEIPYGSLTSYGDIARQLAQRMGRPSMSSQAVGGAVGHNPISIIIPCHRVVGAQGSLTGYAGGLDKKTWLLEHEGAKLSGLFRPSRGTAL